MNHFRSSPAARVFFLIVSLAIWLGIWDLMSCIGGCIFRQAFYYSPRSPDIAQA